MSYYQFYVEWKKKLLDLEEAGCEIPGPQTLYIQFMQKLSQDLKTATQSKEHVFGNESIPRRPKTWMELHQTVTTELQNRADSRPAGELVMAVTPGNQGLCGLCNRGDHSQQHCPRAYAQTIGDAPKCLKENEKGRYVHSLRCPGSPSPSP
jgi:hypothetical protein